MSMSKARESKREVRERRTEDARRANAGRCSWHTCPKCGDPGVWAYHAELCSECFRDAQGPVVDEGSAVGLTYTPTDAAW